MKAKTIFVCLFFSVFCETVCAQYEILTAVMSKEKNQKVVSSVHASKRVTLCCDLCEGKTLSYTDPYWSCKAFGKSACCLSFQKIEENYFVFAEYMAFGVNTNKDYVDSVEFVFLDKSSIKLKADESYYGVPSGPYFACFRSRVSLNGVSLDDFFNKGLLSIGIITKGGYKEACYVPLDRACYVARCEMFFFHNVKESESDVYAKLSDYDKKNKQQSTYDGNVRGYLERE